MIMKNEFDKLIFLISTDCFAPIIFDGFSEDCIGAVKLAARSVIPKMIDGGDNYFLCADFSPARLKATKNEFLKELKESNSGEAIFHKIHFLHKTLEENARDRVKAAEVILSVLARIYWLNDDQLKIPLTEEIIDLIAEIEPIGLDVARRIDEWEDKWLNSSSKWDQYVMSLMDDIPDVPYLTYLSIARFSSQFDFLREWKRSLGNSKFAVLKNYVLTEAHAEIDDLDALSGAELDNILAGI